MPTKEKYLIFIKEQLSGIEDVSFKKMMGEYLVYYKGKYVAALCDDHFLIKAFSGAEELLPSVRYEKPYEGAKDMLLVEITDDAENYRRLLEAAYHNLPDGKLKREKHKRCEQR